MQQSHVRVVTSAREFVIASVLFKNIIGKKLGLNITDNGCLNYLLIRGSASPAELAKYSGLTTGSVTTMIDRLEKLGYIFRKPNPKDRRALEIHISDTARNAIIPLTRPAQSAQIDLMKVYTDEELDMIAAFVHAFAQTIKSQASNLENVESPKYSHQAIS